MNRIKQALLPLIFSGAVWGNVDSLTTKLIIDTENNSLYRSIDKLELAPAEREQREFQITAELYARGYEPDHSYITPMHIAAITNDTILAAQWLDSLSVDPKVSFKNTPLALSMKCGSAQMTSWLIRNGANIHKSSNNREETFRSVLEQSYFYKNPKTEAVYDTVLNYLDDASYVLSDDITYLHLASMTDNNRLAKIALAAGVSPDFRDRHGFTPFITAVSRSHQAITKLLLRAGADKSAQIEYGTNLASTAFRSRDIKMLKKCLRWGQRVDDPQPYAALDQPHADSAMVRCAVKNRKKLGLIPVKYPTAKTIASLTEKTGDFTLLDQFYPLESVEYGMIQDLIAAKSEKVLAYWTNVIPEHKRIWKNDWLMVEAARSNMPILLHSLIDQGMAIDSVLTEKRHYKAVDTTTALLLAIENRHTDLVLNLLDRGADLPAAQSLSKRSLLEIAIGHKNIPLLDRLVKEGYSFKSYQYGSEQFPPFFSTITSGDSSIYSHVKQHFSFDPADSDQQRELERYLARYSRVPYMSWSYDSLLALGVDPRTPHYEENALFRSLLELGEWEMLDDLAERGYPLDSIYSHDELLLLLSELEKPRVIGEILKSDRPVADSTGTALLKTWYVNPHIGDALWERFDGESHHWNYDSLFLNGVNFLKFPIALFALERGGSIPPNAFLYGGPERMKSLAEYNIYTLLTAVWNQLQALNRVTTMRELAEALFLYGSAEFVQGLIESGDIVIESNGLWYVTAPSAKITRSQGFNLIRKLIETDRGDMLALFNEEIFRYNDRETVLRLVKEAIAMRATSVLDLFAERKLYSLEALETYLGKSPYAFAMEIGQEDMAQLFPEDSLWIAEQNASAKSDNSPVPDPFSSVLITDDYNELKAALDTLKLSDSQLHELLKTVLMRRSIAQTELVLKQNPVLTDSTLWFRNKSPLEYALVSDKHNAIQMVASAMLKEQCSKELIQDIFGAAVQIADTTIAKEAFRRGADIEQRVKGTYGNKQLALLNCNNSVEMMEFLLNNGVPDLNPMDMKRLIDENKTALLERILQRGYDLNKPIEMGLTLAFVPASYRVYQLMKEYGADLSVRDEKGYTPLMFAARGNRVPEMQWLIAHGADPSVKFPDNSRYPNRTVLEYAIEERNVSMVNMLLTMGVTGAASTDRAEYENHPLILAAGMNNVGYGANSIMFKLIADADLPYPTDSASLADLLYKGMWQSNETLVNWAIANGADVNQEYPSRRTVLEYACEKSSLEIVKALITAGAEIQPDRGRYQRDLLELAASRTINYSTRENGVDIVEYLRTIIPPEKYSLEASIELTEMAVILEDTTLLKELVTLNPKGVNRFILEELYESVEWKESEVVIRWLFENQDIIPLWPNTLTRTLKKMKNEELLAELNRYIEQKENGNE